MKKIERVIKALKENDNFLITSHINLEGDSFGSQLAMANLLKKLDKKYIIFDNDPVPKAFRFLMHGESIKTSLCKSDRFKAAIVLDCPVIERVGKVAPYVKKAGVVINIDHHISNKNFGDIIWVEPKISCTGEMIYHLYKSLGVEIDRKAALSIYVAILTDTGSFAYENTNYITHQIVSELLKTGIRPLWVGKQLHESKTLNDLRLLNETLKTLKLYYNGQVAVLYTSAKMLRRLKLKPSSTENFVNYARSINKVKIAIFFLERPDKPGEVHLSFRSKGEINVNKLAALFKGGGHPNASGCLIKGTIAHAKKIVLHKIRHLYFYGRHINRRQTPTAYEP